MTTSALNCSKELTIKNHPPVTDKLIQFIQSRASLIEFELAKDSHSMRKPNKSAIRHAFFYPLHDFIGGTNWVSEKATAKIAQLVKSTAKNNLQLWPISTGTLSKLEALSIRSRINSEFILDHIVTGGMVIKKLKDLLSDNSSLDVTATAQWVCENYRVACILKEENKVLDMHGYKSNRGVSLESALDVYAECGIQVVTEKTVFISQLK